MQPSGSRVPKQYRWIVHRQIREKKSEMLLLQGLAEELGPVKSE